MELYLVWSKFYVRSFETLLTCYCVCPTAVKNTWFDRG